MKGFQAKDLGIDLFDSAAELAADSIARYIDLEVVFDLFVSGGWKEVRFESFQGMIRLKAMTKWCSDTLEGKFMFAGNGSRFIFERDDEAVLFKLRWK